MQFLVTAKLKDKFTKGSGPPDDFSSKAQQDMVSTKRLYAEGIIRHVWQNGENTGVVLLLEAASEDAITELWEGFPLIKAGYLDVNIEALNPYPGFRPDD